MHAELEALTAPILQYIVDVHNANVAGPAIAEVAAYRTQADDAFKALTERTEELEAELAEFRAQAASSAQT